MRGRTGWPSVIEWTLALSLAAFAVVSVMSIGMFVLPFAVAAAAIVARRNRTWPESVFGGLLGAAAVCLLVAYLNRAYSPCPAGPMWLGPGEHVRCGGLNPLPWLTVGALLTAVGLVGYAAFRRHREPAT